MFPKESAVVLSAGKLRALGKEVFAADKTCLLCRWCSAVPRGLTGFEVHHVIKRSRLRLDTFDNLMTVCLTHHQGITERRIYVVWSDIHKRIPQIVSHEEYRSWVEEYIRKRKDL